MRHTVSSGPPSGSVFAGEAALQSRWWNAGSAHLLAALCQGINWAIAATVLIVRSL